MSQVLPQDILIYALVFARVGAMVMTLPALGEAIIPPRVRLTLALALVILLEPLVGSTYPANATATPLMLVGMLTLETIVGLAIGLMLRILLTAVGTAGNVIAMQSGLAFAQTFDPSAQTQSALVSTFLSLLALVLIFAGNLHHLLIAGIEQSFTLFPPGKIFPTGDFAKLAVETVSEAFTLGVQMASPFLVFGLILYGGAGVIARLMPQVQIFFLAMPLNILAGFVLLALTISTMMLWFIDAFATKIQLFAPL
ncbi:MAG: flagellar type III secretion system protein FliR [Alphaproteobacteria bacterium]|nr:flagellar type III secretion system protein FliR [Alphaproteobacteria bacterium]